MVSRDSIIDGGSDNPVSPRSGVNMSRTAGVNPPPPEGPGTTMEYLAQHFKKDGLQIPCNSGSSTSSVSNRYLAVRLQPSNINMSFPTAKRTDDKTKNQAAPDT